MSAAVVVAGCSSTPVVLPSRDLDRPTDMAFACIGVSTSAIGTEILGGAPMGNCHPSGVQDTKTGTIDSSTALPDPNDPTMRLPNTGTQYRTYAFVTNSDRGDLSVIDMSFCRPGDARCWPPGAALIDLDPDLVGYAAAPLGVLPEVVAASQDGCRVVSANRGSCDLTFVDPAVLLTPHVVPLASNRDPGTPDISTFATTIVPRTDSGRLNLAPGEIAFLPQQTGNLPEGKKATPDKPTATYCDANGTFAAPVGTPPATDAASVPWRAVVTFPSCDLVALLDLPSGNVVDSWRVGKIVDSNGTELSYSFVHTGRNPACPADCAPSLGDDGASPDAGLPVDAADDSTAPPAEDGGPLDASADDATSGDDASTEAGTVVSGVVVPPSGKLSIGALAIHPEGTHVYFGATNASHVGVLDIKGDTLVPGTGSAGLPPGSAALHAGPGGSTRIRLSVDPFAYSKGHDAQDPTRPEYGRFVAGAHDVQPDDPLEFLYVIARDGSVRVLDVADGKVPYECDTGIDPNDPNALAVTDDDSIRKACFPYPAPVAMDPTVPPPRRLPSAGGPGLRFAGIPQDIAFANYLTELPAPDTVDPNVTETTLSGAFAFVMSTTGSVYTVNIDPALRYIKQVRATDKATCDALEVSGIMEKGGYGMNAYCAGRFPESPRPLTHSLRDANVVSYSTGLGPQNGPPRLDTPPIGPVTGPSLRSFTTYESTINPLAAPSVMTAGIGERLTVPTTTGSSTYVYFPNRYTVTAQSWTISWEGDLTGVRYSGALAAAKTLKADLRDNGAGFCGLGATDGDVVTLMGCNDDTGCAPGTVCVHADGVPTSVDGRPISGLCLDQNNVTDLSSDTKCGLLLKTFRRYEIIAAANPTLTLQPKRDEVPRPVFTFNGDHAGERVSCVTDADCRPEMDTVHADFKCVKMSSPPPECDPLDPAACGPAQPTRRCLQPCRAGLPCRQGRVCVDGFPETEGSFCADGAPIDPDCFPQLVSYKVSAGNTFVVSGSAVGRVETVVETAKPAGPECEIPLSTPPQSIARIRMNTALCDPAVDLTDPAQPGQLKDTAIVANSPKANPCFMIQACPTDTMPGGVCRVGALTSPCTLINGDDTSQTCTCPAGSSAATPSKWTCGSAVPRLSAFFENHEFRFVLGGLEQPIADVFQIRFDVHGGLGPQLVLPSVDANPGLPARILLGPIPQPEQLTPGTSFQPTLSDGTRDKKWISDLPYLFVVDQRQFTNSRLGARGQILRITPRVSDTVPVSAFEAFAAGGQYFPIQ